MKSIAADDEVAIQPVRRILAAPGYECGAAIDAVRCHVDRVPHQFDTARDGAVEQVAHDLLLAIDRHRGTAGQLRQIDAEHRAVAADVRASVHDPFPLQPVGQAKLPEQVSGDALQHAGADTAFDIGAVAPFHHHAGHAAPVQHVRQEETGRTGADDGDLRTHALPTPAYPLNR